MNYSHDRNTIETDINIEIIIDLSRFLGLGMIGYGYRVLSNGHTLLQNHGYETELEAIQTVNTKLGI